MYLLKSLILVSEKAANVARICRQHEHLFQLLIEEKKCDEANPRFVQDFKTLADVLIQETVKHDIGNEFPEIRSEIRGEESNVFCNTLGESIAVEVLESRNETSELLAKVLNGDGEAADLLADEVHREISMCDVGTASFPEGVDSALDYDNVGIWIDPIDSTAEYISGVEAHGKNKIATSGLKCVTVLIGVYNLQTGNPLIGVINQPFVENVDEKWRGRCYWGFSGISSLKCSRPLHTNTICISGSEDAAIKEKLTRGGFALVEAAGAGYKILATITGAVDAYLLSKDSTFKWDTCGPQAILKSLGGDIVIYEEAMRNSLVGINYVSGVCEKKIESCANRGGIIAYRNEAVLNSILNILRC